MNRRLANFFGSFFMGVHMKPCIKCGIKKPLTEFYKHSMMADGFLNKCKVCCKEDARERRFGPRREYVLEYDRQRAYRPERLNENKRRSKKYRQDFPDRYSAHQKVASALKSGKLVALPCLICGEKAEAHHPDYGRPLDVVWLCPSHHRQTHAMFEKMRRGD